jgi:hypothetical protein
MSTTEATKQGEEIAPSSLAHSSFFALLNSYTIVNASWNALSGGYARVKESNPLLKVFIHDYSRP